MLPAPLAAASDVLLIAAVVSGGAVLVCAALHDVAARTVPNRACGLIAGAGLVAQALQGTLMISVPAALAVFVVAALCWRRGWMGGGDVKLLGAVSLLVPPSGILPMLCATALAGGLLALVYLAGRIRGRRGTYGWQRPAGLPARALRAERWRMGRACPMPYAVAIACGTFYALTQGGLS